MAFWRQGGNDSLNDKLVRPRESGSYWDRKPAKGSLLKKEPQPSMDEPVEQAIASADPDLEIETIIDEPEIKTEEQDTANLNEADAEVPSAIDELDLPDLPDTPDLDMDIPDDSLVVAKSDEDLELPPPPSSLEALSMDQDDFEESEKEEDISDTSYSDIDFEDVVDEEAADTEDSDLLASDASFSQDTPSIEEDELTDFELPELPDQNFSDLSEETDDLSETLSDDIPPPPTSLNMSQDAVTEDDLEAEEQQLVMKDTQEKTGFEFTAPPAIPSSSGNTAHKIEEEHLEAEIPESNEEETKFAEDEEEISDSEPVGNNALSNVIAFPPSSEIETDTLDANEEDDDIREANLATQLSEEAADQDQSPDTDLYAASVAAPKGGPIVTPRRTAAAYLDEDEQIYEPGEETDEGYYVPTPNNSDGSGRRTALYLAGAASISAICAAVYFMLPNDNSEVQTANLDTDPTGTIPNFTTSTSDRTTPETSTTEAVDLPAINDTQVFDNLETQIPEEADDLQTTSSEDLFAERDIAEAPTVTENASATGERDLSTPPSTLATPDQTIPDASLSETKEAPAALSLSNANETSPAASNQETVQSEPLPPSIPTVTEEASVGSAPSIAPSIAPKIGRTDSSASQSSGIKLPKILRSAEKSEKATPALSVTVTDRVYNGPLRAGSLPQIIIDKLFAAGAYLSSSDHKSFSYNVRQAVKTAEDGDVSSIRASNGSEIELQFLSSQYEVRPTFVARSSNIEPLPTYMMLKDDWVRVINPTKLVTAPSQYDNSVVRSLPLNAALQRMGSVTDSSGQQWSMLGKDGVAVGYVPAETVSPIGLQETVTPFSVNVANRIVERIDVSTPCRTMNIGIGGVYSASAACLTPDGDWMVKDTSASGQSISPRIAGPIALGTPDYAAANISQTSAINQTNKLSKDAEAILFEPETMRRDARHGLGSPSQRIESLFTSAPSSNNNKTISITSPDGRMGHVSFDQDSDVQPISASTISGSDFSVSTGWVQVNRQVRLMNAPAGTPVSEADTVKRGDLLEVISISTAPNGESWTLLGQNGQSYGYVLSDYTSVVDSNSINRANIYSGYNANATAQSSSDIAELKASKVDCQTASYTVGADTGELKACLQPNGQWTAEVTPTQTYDIRATAYNAHLQGQNNLW